MRPSTLPAALATLVLLSASCVRAAGDAKPATATAAPKASAGVGAAVAPAAKPATPAPKATEPEHITIQHVLIGFTGSVPGKNITRTQEEAKTLAHQILERAKKGEDFDALVKEYTDDSPPGIYAMANTGVQAVPPEYSRGRMVPAFGDAGFPLKVGEIGIAEYDATRSPYGWHVVKRLK